MTGRLPHILWGITGSVAAIRSDRLGHELAAQGELKAIVTRRAQHFLPEGMPEVPIYSDDDEWSSWKKLGDPVLHIELRRWADVLVIAPLSADALAKMAHGICDTLLLSVARAWDYSRPVIVAPAMNTMMWEHPLTTEHLDRLRSWGVGVVDPVSKELACADVGMGAQAPADAIVAMVRRATSREDAETNRNDRES
jgi:phosphopantothenoylcysteine decarboxylase